MEIKYTSDGKKVAVIGNLNSQTKIVQEIFIVNGQEIPSGENFTVTSLHDAPAISWRESTLKEFEKKYEESKKEYENKIRILRDKKSVVEEKLSYLGKFLKNSDESSFENIVNFITGNIKYIVKKSWGEIEILKYDEFIENKEGYLRLLSISGRDDGTLKFQLNKYGDYSGGCDEIFIFANEENAKEKLKELTYNADISDGMIKCAEKYNIQLNEDKLKIFYDKRRSEFNSSIDRAKYDISKWEAEIIKMNK